MVPVPRTTLSPHCIARFHNGADAIEAAARLRAAGVASFLDAGKQSVALTVYGVDAARATAVLAASPAGPFLIPPTSN